LAGEGMAAMSGRQTIIGYENLLRNRASGIKLWQMAWRRSVSYQRSGGVSGINIS